MVPFLPITGERSAEKSGVNRAGVSVDSALAQTLFSLFLEEQELGFFCALALCETFERG